MKLNYSLNSGNAIYLFLKTSNFLTNNSQFLSNPVVYNISKNSLTFNNYDSGCLNSLNISSISVCCFYNNGLSD